MLFAGSRAGACRASASRRHPAGWRTDPWHLPVRNLCVAAGSLQGVPRPLRTHAAGDLEPGEGIEAMVRTAPPGAWHSMVLISAAGGVMAFAMAAASRAPALVAAGSSGLGAIAGAFLARWLVGLRGTGAPFGEMYLTVAATDRRLLFSGRSPALGLLRGPLLGAVRYPDLVSIRAVTAGGLSPGGLSLVVAGGRRPDFETRRADVPDFVRIVERLAGP